MFFGLFCSHNYVLYDEYDEYINFGRRYQGCHTFHFVCRHCGKTMSLITEEIERDLSHIKSIHRQKRALNQFTSLSSKMYVKQWGPGPKKEYEGSEVTELIRFYQNKGIDTSFLKSKEYKNE